MRIVNMGVAITARPRSYHHGNLRAALVAEGLVVLAESDRADLSLRELARRVGVSSNAAYRHFGDKEALLAAMASEGFNRLTASLLAADALVDPDDPAERIRAYGRAYIRQAREHPALFRLMFGHDASSQRTEELAVAEELPFDALRAGIASMLGVKANDERVRLGMVYAWSLVHGLSHLVLDGQIERGIDATIESVLQIASAPPLLDRFAGDSRSRAKTA